MMSSKQKETGKIWTSFSKSIQIWRRSELQIWTSLGSTKRDKISPQRSRTPTCPFATSSYHFLCCLCLCGRSFPIEISTTNTLTGSWSTKNFILLMMNTFLLTRSVLSSICSSSSIPLLLTRFLSPKSQWKNSGTPISLATSRPICSKSRLCQLVS